MNSSESLQMIEETYMKLLQKNYEDFSLKRTDIRELFLKAVLKIQRTWRQIVEKRDARDRMVEEMKKKYKIDSILRIQRFVKKWIGFRKSQEEKLQMRNIFSVQSTVDNSERMGEGLKRYRLQVIQEFEQDAEKFAKVEGNLFVENSLKKKELRVAQETQTIPDEKKKEKKQKKEDVDFYHHDPLWDVKCIENVHKGKIDYSTENKNTPYGSFDNRGSYKNRNKSAIFTQRKKNRFRVKTATICHRKKLKTKSQIEADTRSFKLTDHRGHEISRGNVEVPVKSQYSKLKTHHRSNAQSNRFIMNSSTTNTSKLRRIKMSFIKTSTPSQKPRKKPYNSSID